MASTLNRATLIGRLGADPELRSTQGGHDVANFSLATDESWKDKNGNKVERTEWHKIVAWGNLAGICSKYLRKGSLIFAEGKIQSRSWDDKEGVKRYTTEIIAQTVKFLEPRRKADSEQPPGSGGGEHDYGPPPMSDDDVPF